MDVDDGRLELPGGHLAVEQDIDLTVRAVLELGQEEEGHDPAHARGAAPDEAALARDVPPRRVEQLRGEVDHGDLGDVVGGPADARAQGAEPHRRRLGDDGVGDWAQGAGVDERDEDAEAGLGVVGRVVLRDRGADAEDHEEGYVDACAPEVDCAAAEPGGDEPGADIGDELEARVDQAQLERKVGRHARLYAECQLSELERCEAREGGWQGHNIRSKKNVAWLAIRLPAKFCDV